MNPFSPEAIRFVMEPLPVPKVHIARSKWREGHPWVAMNPFGQVSLPKMAKAQAFADRLNAK